MVQPTTFPYILIGASAGGVHAMLELVATLPPAFPAPILLVQHIGSHRSQLAQLLSDRGANRAVEARDGEQPAPGIIHVAPPDHHMLIERGRIRLTRGPKEHHARPAIDPLFRSAALDLGPRAIGVVLTGMLDDGSAGLGFVRQCGGTTVVQDPADAAEPGMPRAALAATPVDHVVPLAAMAGLLLRLARACPPSPSPPHAAPVAASPHARMEHAVSFGDHTMQDLRTIAQPSTFSCPDCGGVLFELDDRSPVRYRCHTGHAFSLLTLLASLEQMTDVALWAAVRALREKEGLLRRLAEVEGAHDREAAAGCLAEADDLARTVDVFRQVMSAAPSGGGIDG
jgi:two-component system chemotaxis response regulator CheB